MALSSNVPLCAAGDCYEQLSIEGSPASPRRAADGGLGFSRKPRTMALLRSAMLRSVSVRTAALGSGSPASPRRAADDEQGFSRKPRTMAKRHSVGLWGALRSRTVRNDHWQCEARRRKAWLGSDSGYVAKHRCAGAYTFRMPSPSRWQFFKNRREATESGTPGA